MQRAIQMMCVTATMAVMTGLASNQVHAGVILSRADLVNALGGAAATEDFESWNGTVLTPGGWSSLDSSTIVEGQGPGIVNDGLRFTNINSNRELNELQLDRRSEYGITSGALLAEGGTLVINFLGPVTHAGLDFFQFRGWQDTATVRVYGSDDTSMIYDSSGLAAPNAPSSTFFAYTDAAGIGRITIQSTSYGWSPLIDDLTYGVVPEPATLSLLALGGLALLRRRGQHRG